MFRIDCNADVQNMMTPYGRLRRLLFISPLWLLANHALALKPPKGDDLPKSFSSKPKRQSERKSDFSLSENSPFSAFDDSDLSDFDDDSAFSKLSENFDQAKLEEDEFGMDLEGEEEESFQQNSLLGELTAGKETMYEAYNQLHTLAQVSRSTCNF